MDYAVDVMGGDPSHIDTGTLIYFGTYVVVVGYVLTSIVVAVLLENFNAAKEEEVNNSGQIYRGQMDGVLALRVSNNQLDPLLSQLSNFENTQDLSNRIGGFLCLPLARPLLTCSITRTHTYRSPLRCSGYR